MPLGKSCWAIGAGETKLGGRGSVSRGDGPGPWLVPTESAGHGNDLYFLLRTTGCHQRILKEGRKKHDLKCMFKDYISFSVKSRFERGKRGARTATLENVWSSSNH